jgi:hypothetical protein
MYLVYLVDWDYSENVGYFEQEQSAKDFIKLAKMYPSIAFPHSRNSYEKSRQLACEKLEHLGPLLVELESLKPTPLES